jgi:SEC-C motif-containing protein
MKEKPKSARAMVRARYCAYARGAGNNREFLLRTWHPTTARNLTRADLSNDSFKWTGLDIIKAEQKGDVARVEFKAYYEDSEGRQHTHHELSAFQRIKGVWLYLDGQIAEQPRT